MEVKVAYYKAGPLEVLWGGRKSSHSYPRVRSAYKGIINIRNYKGEYITGLDL
jgi:hypothetical protein